MIELAIQYKIESQFMAKSLLEQLPEIVAKGRQVAEKILENLESRTASACKPAKGAARPRQRGDRLDYRQ
jgi:hypothetical protein